MTYHDQEARIEAAKKRAGECSDQVVASGHMCTGCYGDAYCDVSAKFAEAYPDRTLISDIVLMIVNSGKIRQQR